MQARPRVMVVDDDPIMQALCEEALGEEFEISQALSGSEFLGRPLPPGLQGVLMDVQMPGLDGYETCRRFRARDPGAPPVLFVSACDRLQDRLKGYDAGGSDYVCKPWDRAELALKVRRLLAAEQARRALAEQRDEALQVALCSVGMTGELGVVLDFLRVLNACQDYAAVAQALFGALGRYGLSGCVRIAGPLGSLSANRNGHCTALEWSILESLAAQPDGPRIRAIDQNTSFDFGRVILFVRERNPERAAESEAERRERLGRCSDNVALLLEGALTRLNAIDLAVSPDLERERQLVAAACQGLGELGPRHCELAGQLRGALERLQSGLEEGFVSLGLSRSQQEHLAELVRSHAEDIAAALAHDRQTEHRLERIRAELGAGL